MENACGDTGVGCWRVHFDIEKDYLRGNYCADVPRAIIAKYLWLKANAPNVRNETNLLFGRTKVDRMCFKFEPLNMLMPYPRILFDGVERIAEPYRQGHATIPLNPRNLKNNALDRVMVALEATTEFRRGVSERTANANLRWLGEWVEKKFAQTLRHYPVDDVRVSEGTLRLRAEVPCQRVWLP